MLTALMVLVLLALCGFIAYIGDLLGRRLGKKRLTLFGLRPKHTAIVLTIVTGVLIAAVTFGAALVMVPGFRQVVTKGERLARDNTRLARQNQQRREESDLLTRKNGELTRQNETVAAQNRTLTGRNEDLGKLNDGLKVEQGRLQAAVAGLQSTNQRLQAEARVLVAQQKTLQAQQKKLQEQQRLLLVQNKAYIHEQEAYRRGPYLYRRDDEILPAQVLLPGAGKSDVRRILSDLLARAESEVRSRPKHDGKRPFTLAVPTGYDGKSTEPRAIIEWLAERAFRKRNTSQVLQVVSAVNVLQGRTVLAELRYFPNEQVLVKGDELGRTNIDGSGSSDYIFTELVSLQDRVRLELTQRKVRLANADNRLTPATLAATFDLARRLKEMNRPMTVVARARENTRRLGPAYVDFEAVPMSAASR